MIKKPDGSIQFKPKDGYRNEPLDCRVYALAAVEALKSADPRCFNMADFIEQGCDALGIPEEMTLEEQQWWEGRSSRRVDDLKATLAEAAEKQIRAGMAGEAPKPGRPVATAPSRQPAQVFQDQPQAVVQTDPSSVRPTIQKPFVFKKR
jgi:phage terminase large subunit GpA-like protein